MRNGLLELLIVVGVVLAGLAVAGAIWANPRLSEYTAWLCTSVDALGTTFAVVVALLVWRQW